MHEGQIDLLPGERVIWAGQPVRRPLFNPGDLFNVPFGLLWLGGVTLFFFYNHDTAFHKVAWVALTLAGVFHLAGRPLIRYLRLGSTTYAVTDGRVIATSSMMRHKEETAELAELDDPVVVAGPGKSGTITFGRLGVLAWASANYGATTAKGKKPAVVLVGVSDVNKVRDKLAKAVVEARLRHPPKVEPAEAESVKAKAAKAKPAETEVPETEVPKVEVPEPALSETEARKTEKPKTEKPKPAPSKTEPSKTEPSKTEPSKTEAPRRKPRPFKTATPEVDPPKAETPEAEAPRAEPSKAESPDIEWPQDEPSKAEQPTTELPRVEDPTTELPKVKDSKPEPEKRKAGASKAEQPTTELPKVKDPAPATEEPKS